MPEPGSHAHQRHQSLREFQKNVKVAKALFRVYVIFLIMWLPVAVLILMGWGPRVHPVWYILTVLMAHGNSSINCLVYALSLDHFREGYLRLLGLRRGVVGPAGKTQRRGGDGASVNNEASTSYVKAAGWKHRGSVRGPVTMHSEAGSPPAVNNMPRRSSAVDD